MQEQESEIKRVTTKISQTAQAEELSVSETASRTSAVSLGTPSPPQSEFWITDNDSYRIAGPPPKIPPDTETERRKANPVQWSIWQPADRLKRAAAGFEGKRTVTTLDRVFIRRPMSQFWIDAKGVMAVTIASVY
jgi:hypothetical protein